MEIFILELASEVSIDSGCHKWIFSLNSHSTRIRFPEVSTTSETPNCLLIVHELIPILLMSFQKVSETLGVWRKSVKYVSFLKIQMRIQWPLCREGNQKPSVPSKLPGEPKAALSRSFNCLETSYGVQKWATHLTELRKKRQWQCCLIVTFLACFIVWMCSSALSLVKQIPHL